MGPSMARTFQVFGLNEIPVGINLHNAYLKSGDQFEIILFQALRDSLRSFPDFKQHKIIILPSKSFVAHTSVR